MGLLDKFKSEEQKQKEAERKMAEDAIRQGKTYKEAIEKARLGAMLKRDRAKIDALYSTEKKTPLAGTPVANVFNAEFGGKGGPKATGNGTTGFINPNPPMPDWMKKKKVP